MSNSGMNFPEVGSDENIRLETCSTRKFFTGKHGRFFLMVIQEKVIFVSVQKLRFKKSNKKLHVIIENWRGGCEMMVLMKIDVNLCSEQYLCCPLSNSQASKPV